MLRSGTPLSMRRKPDRHPCLRSLGGQTIAQEEVDTGALLLGLVRRLRRHVVFANEAANAVAL